MADVSFDLYRLADLRLILGPLFVHIVFASLLRGVGLFPFVADRCLWMATSSSMLAIWWYLLGWWPSALEGNAADVYRAMPVVKEHVEWFIVFQWYLFVYFASTIAFSHKFSRKGWLIQRKFIAISLLGFCLWKGWSPPSMVIKCVYLIMRIMVVDLGVDFYYLIDSFKNAAEFDEEDDEGSIGSTVNSLLKIAFPMAMVAWLLFVVKDVYVFMMEHQAPIFAYVIVAYTLLIQLMILSPLSWKPKRKRKKQ